MSLGLIQEAAEKVDPDCRNLLGRGTHICLVGLVWFEIGSHYVALAELELHVEQVGCELTEVGLPLSPERCD